MSNKNSIQVAIKVRPLLRKEKNMPICWRVKEKSIQLDGGAGDPYYFDHIFDHDANNELIFETMAKHIVHAGIKGFNGTIFAYGQTSSGKTYTMIGDDNNPGVMVLAAKEIFKEIERTTDREFLLRVGYIEIYNEKIYDLLKKQNTDLKIHETASGNVSVACEEVVITTEEDLLRYLCLGNKERTTGETQMNERSSRSHAIFRIIIESRKVERSEDDAIIQSVLNLVDLAGSERADQTGATGARLKEGGHINKSLLFLSTVIKRLSENEDDSFISFRDSKLTRILQASLGGNALTSIICTIKPTAVDETQSTLSFALRAKNVKNKPQVNEIVSDSTMMKRLEREIKTLKARLEEERNKNESQLKVGQLEQHLRGELFKIITSNSLYNVRKLNEKRRRTWCPNTQNSGNEMDDIVPALPPPTPAILSRIPTNNEPLITVRSVTESPFVRSETFVKDQMLEIKEEEFLPGEICNFDITPPVNEPEATQNFTRTLSLTPLMNKHQKENSEAVKIDMFELQEFLDLEKKVNFETDLKNTQTQLQEYKRRSDDYEKRIDTLEKANAIANNEISKYEEQMTNLKSKIKELQTENQNLVGLDVKFERLRNKSKLRENELLDLLEEKNIKLEQLQKSLDKTIQKHLSNSKDNLEQENENLHIEIQELKQRIEGVQSQLLESAQNESLQQNVCDLQKKYDEMVQQHEELSNEYNDLSSQLMDSLQEGESLRNLCQKLEMQLDVVRTESKELTSSKDKLEAENNALRAQLADAWDKGDTKTNQLQRKLIASSESEGDTHSSLSHKSSGIGSTLDIDSEEVNKMHVNETTDLVPEHDLVAEWKQQLETMRRENEELRVRNNALIEEHERAIAEVREEITKLSTALLEKTICVEALEKEHAEMSMVYEELQTKIKHRSTISPSDATTENMAEDNTFIDTLCENDNNNSEEPLVNNENEELTYSEEKLQTLQATLKDTQKQLNKMEIRCQELELEMLQKLEDSADIYRENLRKSQLEWQQEREMYMQKTHQLQENLEDQKQQMKAIKESIECQKLEEQSKAYENLVKLLDKFKSEKNTLEEQCHVAQQNNRVLLESNNLALSEKEILQHKIEQYDKENNDKNILIDELNKNIKKLTEENSTLEKEVITLKELNIKNELKASFVEKKLSDIESRYSDLQVEHNQLREEKTVYNKEKEDISSEKYEIDDDYEKLKEEHKNCAFKSAKHEKMEIELDELSKKSDQLENLLSELQNKYAELQAEHTQLQIEKNKLSAEKAKIQIENQEIDLKYKNLEKEHTKCVPMLNKYEQLEVEVIELTKSSDHLKSELDELQNKHAGLEVEHTHLRKQMLNYESEKGNILIENDEICKKYKNLLEEHSNCASKLKKYEQLEVELNELQNKHADLVLEHTHLRKQMLNYETEKGKILIDNDEICKKYKNLVEEHSRCASKLKKCEQLEIELRKLTKNSDQQQSELNELQNKYGNLEVEHTRLRKEMLNYETENGKILIKNVEIGQKYKNLIEEHSSCASKLKKCEQLEIEMGNLTKNSDQIQSKLNALQNKYEDLKVEHTQLCAVKCKLEAEKEEILVQKQQIDQKYDELDKENKKCASELYKYRQLEVGPFELSEIQNKNVELQQELQNMLTQKSSFEIENGKILIQNQEIMQKYVKLQKDHENCNLKLNKYADLEIEIREKYDRLNTNLNQIEHLHVELQVKHQILQTEKNNLEAEKSMVLKEKHEILQNIDNLRKEHTKLDVEHKECAQKSYKHEQLEIEVKELKNKSEQLENKLRALESEYANLQAENTKLKKEKEQILAKNQDNENRMNYSKLEVEHTKLKNTFSNMEKEMSFLQNEKSMRMELEKRLKMNELDVEKQRKEFFIQLEKSKETIKQKDITQGQLREDLNKLQREYKLECEKFKATITGLLQEKKILQERLCSMEDVVAKLRSENSTNTSMESTSIIPSNSPSQQHKRRSGGSCEGINKQKACLERKNRRLSTHDDNRKLFCDATRDVGSMTDPHVCSCAELELKLAESEKNKFISESQVVTLKMALRNHPLKEENDKLMKRLKEELDRHSAEVRSLKKIIIEKTTAAAQMAQNAAEASATARAEVVAQSLKNRPKINSTTQTESILETEFNKLQSKFTELKDICRQRLKTIQSLEKEIAEKENISRGADGNCLPPELSVIELQNKNLKEELNIINSKYMDAKKVLTMRRVEIENLKKELNTFKAEPQLV